MLAQHHNYTMLVPQPQSVRPPAAKELKVASAPNGTLTGLWVCEALLHSAPDLLLHTCNTPIRTRKRPVP